MSFKITNDMETDDIIGLSLIVIRYLILTIRSIITIRE